MNSTSANCPCGSGKAYAACCGQYHQGMRAPNAEALMRSRYSAYVLELESYLLTTWHPDTRPDVLNLKAEAPTQWLRLEVKRHEVGDRGQAIVEFVAKYKVNGKAYRLHETSRFVMEQGEWFYVDGDIGD